MEIVIDFILLGSKITTNGDCGHEIKRHFLLGRKAMTNLDSILKSTDFTLPTKVRLVKAMVFPVSMYGCDFSSIQFFRLSFFTVIKRLFNSSSLSAIRVVSSAYLRLLIFL